MIAKYPGKCAECGKPITPNVDIYDLERKKSFHADCLNKKDLFSDSEAGQLADRLHFLKPGEDLPVSRALRGLPDAD